MQEKEEASFITPLEGRFVTITVPDFRFSRCLTCGEENISPDEARINDRLVRQAKRKELRLRDCNKVDAC